MCVFVLQPYTTDMKNNPHIKVKKKAQTKAEPAGNSADATVSKSSGIRSQAVLTFISIRQHMKKGLLNKIQIEYCYSWTCWV